VTLLTLLVGGLFAILGAGAERLASVWPAEEASRRGVGPRIVLYALTAAAAGAAIQLRSTLPWWATAFQLAFLGLLLLLAATDLEQRRLPHLLLDPLIVAGAAFVPFNPQVTPLDALIGAAAAVAFLGVLGLLIRGGVALGDLYLVAPLGLLLGWPAIFSAIFLAAVLSAVVSVILLATRRVSMRSYIPFGPFLVAGAVVTLVRDPALLGESARVLRAILGA
jgi:leader peptidase (prepilin peptidase) / N-methyltransferase